ncbi:MAG TPA: twin-arginine translocation signal domain-containing protein [Candidatus Acidoferrum sp.]|nr:twin-arginine translocation signal domain-containing protein [Candidatus Acidoferrum sp.]
MNSAITRRDFLGATLLASGALLLLALKSIPSPFTGAPKILQHARKK